jgi:hypothetical protein
VHALSVQITCDKRKAALDALKVPEHELQSLRMVIRFPTNSIPMGTSGLGLRAGALRGSIDVSRQAPLRSSGVGVVSVSSQPAMSETTATSAACIIARRLSQRTCENFMFFTESPTDIEPLSPWRYPSALQLYHRAE